MLLGMSSRNLPCDNGWMKDKMRLSRTPLGCGWVLTGVFPSLPGQKANLSSPAPDVTEASAGATSGELIPGGSGLEHNLRPVEAPIAECALVPPRENEDGCGRHGFRRRVSDGHVAHVSTKLWSLQTPASLLILYLQSSYKGWNGRKLTQTWMSGVHTLRRESVLCRDPDSL